MIRKLPLKSVHQKYYTRDGRGPLPGCSGVCKIGDDTGGLVHWAWKKGMAQEDYREERDEAAYAGDVGHALSEAYLLGDELDLSEYPLESQRLGRISFKKFEDWWLAQKLIFMHSELQLVSDKHLFGGTLDIVGRDGSGKVCLIDLKTTKSLRLSNSIQVAGGYLTAYNENYPQEPIDRVCIIRLPKNDKDVEPVWLPQEHFPVYQKTFLANLSAYYARRELEKIDPIYKSTPWFHKKKK